MLVSMWEREGATRYPFICWWLATKIPQPPQHAGWDDIEAFSDPFAVVASRASETKYSYTWLWCKIMYLTGKYVWCLSGEYSEWNIIIHNKKMLVKLFRGAKLSLRIVCLLRNFRNEAWGKHSQLNLQRHWTHPLVKAFPIFIMLKLVIK